MGSRKHQYLEVSKNKKPAKSLVEWEKNPGEFSVHDPDGSTF